MFPQEIQSDTPKSLMITQTQMRTMWLRFARTVLQTVRAMVVSAY